MLGPPKRPFCGRSVNFAALSTRLSSRWTNSLSSGPCPPKRPHGGHTAYLRGLVHENGLTVDIQLIFGVLSTKTASRWTYSLSSGPCPPKRPHGGHTAYLRGPVHQNGLTVDIQLCGRGCFILPEHLFLVWLWQQMSVPKVPLCLI